MIGHITKVVFVAIAGCLLGYLYGAFLGAFLGALPGLFFREIVYVNQTILMSMALSLISGGLLGFSAVQLINKFFNASDKLLMGVLIGVTVSFIVVFYIDGVIDISSLDFKQSSYAFPIIYGGIVGGDIGAIVFPILGVIRVVREIIETYIEAKKYKKRLAELKDKLSSDTNSYT